MRTILGGVALGDHWRRQVFLLMVHLFPLPKLLDSTPASHGSKFFSLSLVVGVGNDFGQGMSKASRARYEQGQ